MLSINRVLCPTDFSEFSNRALAYATDMSVRWMAKLYVQHVMDVPLMPAPDTYTHATDLQPKREAYAEGIEKELRQRLAPGAHYSKIITAGNPAEEILRIAQAYAVDLIVMGTHGRQGLRRWILGSVAERVVRHAPCPVLTVCHARETTERPIVFRRILVPIDFSKDSLRGLVYALRCAEDCSADVYPLHVIEPLPSPERMAMPLETEAYGSLNPAAVRERLAHLIPESIRKACVVKECVRTGTARAEIVRMAKELNVDLIVMGVVGHGALELALFGSTTYQVMKEAPCPVLAVRVERTNSSPDMSGQ